LPPEEHERFRAVFAAAALGELVLEDQDGGAVVLLARLAADERPEARVVFQQLRREALGDLFLHDPAGFFVPLSARVQGEEAPRPVLDGEEGLIAGVLAPGGRLALLANGGGGKTYVCEHLAHRLARACLELPRGGPVLPIFLRLRDVGRTDEDIVQVLCRRLHCEPRDLRMVARTRRLVFILDSLEESDFCRLHGDDPAKYVALLRSISSLANGSILLTARPSLFSARAVADFLPGFQLAELARWTDEEVGTFFRRCAEEKGLRLPGGWQTFHGFVQEHERLYDLARTPLFARMIAVTWASPSGGKSGLSAVQTEADLYERYTEQCFRRREHQVKVDDAREATGVIAGLMLRYQEDVLPGDTIAHDLARHRLDKGIQHWRIFVERDVLIHGLLVPEGGEDRQGRRLDLHRFSHASFQHFFIAERLAGELLAAVGGHTLPDLLGRGRLAEGVVDFLEQMVRRECHARTVPWIAERLHALDGVREDLFGDIDPEAAGVGFRNVVVLCLRAGGRLEGCDLSELRGEARLGGADLRGASLRRCDLTCTDLEGCVLRDADLSGCRLRGASLAGADLAGTLLTGADLLSCALSYIKGSPRVCGAFALDRVQVAGDDGRTLEVLRSAVESCPQDNAAAREWKRSTLAALEKRLRPLDA
jgi:hypothetical protein